MTKPAIITSIPRPHPLIPGTLVKRYKRFLSDVQLDSGEIVVTHCVNTGAMEGLTRPGIRVWLSPADNPARKLQYTWELAEVDGRTWGVNTSLPNKLVGHLLKQRHLPWLSHWHCHQSEKKYGEKSRVDFWLCDHDPAPDNPPVTLSSSRKTSATPAPTITRQHFLEIKNCHLIYPDDIAYFPDCKSERATAHLRELIHCTAQPDTSAEVLFVVQVPGATAVRPSDLHDPAFAATAREASRAGVKFSAIGVDHNSAAINIYGPIPVDLEPYSTVPHHLWREKTLTS